MLGQAAIILGKYQAMFKAKIDTRSYGELRFEYASNVQRTLAPLLELNLEAVWRHEREYVRSRCSAFDYGILVVT